MKKTLALVIMALAAATVFAQRVSNNKLNNEFYGYVRMTPDEFSTAIETNTNSNNFYYTRYVGGDNAYSTYVDDIEYYVIDHNEDNTSGFDEFQQNMLKISQRLDDKGWFVNEFIYGKASYKILLQRNKITFWKKVN